MSTPPIVHVQPVTPALRDAVLRLHLHPVQADFASPPALTLADAEQCPGSQPMAICQGETVVGYYRLDRSARSLTGEAADALALGLRSFQIDADQQGRGLGTAALAALLADLAQRHPQARRLLLTVGETNAAALALYRRAGFRDAGRRYHGGRAGTERLLWRPLP